MSAEFLQFQKFHYYLIPLVSLVVWWGMLIAMLACWGAQGRPIYEFLDGEYQNPVYLSDIGATNLQPLFIACSGFQGIFFVGTPLMEYVLRRKNKLQPFVSRKQHVFSILGIVLATIGQLGILFVAIFNTNSFENVHLTMVGVFIVCVFLACFFNFMNSFIFGNFPQRLHPDHERVAFGPRRWQNLYMVSFFLKVAWVVCAAAFAVAFGVLMGEAYDSMSARIEWIVCFWYGFLLVLWSMDLFPSAVRKWKITHPDELAGNREDHSVVQPSGSEKASEDGSHAVKV